MAVTSENINEVLNQQQQPAQQKAVPPSVSNDSGGNTSDTILAMLAGLANAVPGAKQIGAGVNAGVSDVYDYATGQKNSPTLGQRYKDYMASENSAQDTAKANNPLAYYATNIAASAPLYVGGAGAGRAALATLPKVGAVLGAGLVGGAEGATQSSARNNDLGTIAGDAGTNAALAMLGEGAGQQIGRGLGWLNERGGTLNDLASDAARDAQIAKMSPEEMAMHSGKPTSSPEVVQAVRQKAADSAAKLNEALDVEKKAIIDSKPVNALAAVGGAWAGSHMGAEGGISGAILGPYLKDLAAGPIAGAVNTTARVVNGIGDRISPQLGSELLNGTPSAVGSAVGIGPQAATSAGQMAQGGFDAITQYLNQPQDERVANFNGQMTDPDARAASNPDNPQN